MTSMPNDATMEAVPAELRQLVERALAEGRRQLANRGGIDPVFLVRMPDSSVQRANIPEPLAEVFNNGDAKEMIFAFVRKWVETKGATAVVFLTDAWVGLPTEKQRQLAREDPAALRRRFEGLSFDAAVEQGLAVRSEALVITVQTAEDVVIVQQPYVRHSKQHRVDFDQRTITHFPQSQFAGRQKMYGVKSDADIK